MKFDEGELGFEEAGALIKKDGQLSGQRIAYESFPLHVVNVFQLKRRFQHFKPGPIRHIERIHGAERS